MYTYSYKLLGVCFTTIGLAKAALKGCIVPIKIVKTKAKINADCNIAM